MKAGKERKEIVFLHVRPRFVFSFGLYCHCHLQKMSHKIALSFEAERRTDLSMSPLCDESAVAPLRLFPIVFLYLLAFICVFLLTLSAGAVFGLCL